MRDFAEVAKAETVDREVADKALTRIAFGSCAHQDKEQPIWDKVKGDPKWQLHEVGGGHDVMADQPEKLLEIVLGLA